MLFKFPLNMQIMFCCALAGVIISVLHVLLCVDVYTDISAYYGPITEAMSKGLWHKAYNGIIPPLNPGIASLLVRLGLHSFTALMIVSGAFYVLCIFPLSGLLRILLNNANYAALGCIMYILTPKIIRFGCTGLLNSARNFFLVCAACLVLSFFEKNRTWKLIALGASLGGLALCRGEGLLYFPLFALWFLLLPWQELRWRFEWRALGIALGRLALVGFITVLCISPRMLQLYRATGIPSTDLRQSEAIRNILSAVGVIKPEAMALRPSQELLNLKGQNKLTTMRKPGKLIQAGVSAQIADIRACFKRLKKAGFSRNNNGFGKFCSLASCFGRGAYLLYFCFAVIGVAVMLCRRQFTFKLWLPVSIIVFSTVIFANVVLAYRYFTLNAVFMLPFSFTGLRFMYEQLVKRRLKYFTLSVFVIVGFLQVKNGASKALERKYDYEKGIGEWLRRHKTDFNSSCDTGLKMLSPRSQFAFWSGFALEQQRDAAVYSDRHYLQNKNINLAVVEVNEPEIVKVIEASGLYKEMKQPFKQMRVFAVLSPKEKMKAY